MSFSNTVSKGSFCEQSDIQSWDDTCKQKLYNRSIGLPASKITHLLSEHQKASSISKHPVAPLFVRMRIKLHSMVFIYLTARAHDSLAISSLLLSLCYSHPGLLSGLFFSGLTHPTPATGWDTCLTFLIELAPSHLQISASMWLDQVDLPDSSPYNSLTQNSVCKCQLYDIIILFTCLYVCCLFPSWTSCEQTHLSADHG